MTFANSLLLAAAVFAAAPAFAKPGETQVSVSYADLNLQSPEGAKALVSRIVIAAREACGPRPYGGELSRLRAYRACVKDATDRAVDAVGVPMVAEIYHRMTVASL